MLLIFPLFLILGLFLPGFFIAKALRQALPQVSAFPLSLLVLFHSIFWLGVFGVPLTLWSVLPCLLAVTAAGAWLARKSAIPVDAESAPPWDMPSRILMVSSGLVGLVLLARSAISPLIGFDTRFRWDFLAQRILALHKFDFYPPLHPADFRTYFYVDGIPPLVSFTHWWMYASAGQYLPVLISIFVTLQFVCTLAFTYGTAAALFSRKAGVLAAALLAACPLFFKSVVLGQETGLTALSIAATLYFIVTAKPGNDILAMVSAGLAAALCPLSREYGWIALIAGAIALLWRRQPLKSLLVFGAVATAVAAPWYVRNWALAGNPFYSLAFGNFAVNPIHTAILQQYNALLGFSRWTGATWMSLLSFALIFATLPFLIGIPGGFARFRQQRISDRDRVPAFGRLGPIRGLHQRWNYDLHPRVESHDGRAIDNRRRPPRALDAPRSLGHGNRRRHSALPAMDGDARRVVPQQPLFPESRQMGGQCIPGPAARR